ncbi:hypothetical protein [Micromonospora sp. AKA38]|uniref:hypothetical protein n=1 Tax=Micromonospora sp. AKA38 TaxID=2733861 RepID=UPI0022C24A8B|nr:hypothetical protein [Micromonospora sp. AKA38]GHJ15358.1 hypothetical protein TPA0908_33530 [Micromonospora sp. AKA38]
MAAGRYSRREHLLLPWLDRLVAEGQELSESAQPRALEQAEAEAAAELGYDEAEGYVEDAEGLRPFKDVQLPESDVEPAAEPDDAADGDAESQAETDPCPDGDFGLGRGRRRAVSMTPASRQEGRDPN